MPSTRWKELERTAARVLGGKRIPRWLDFGQSAPDVLVEDFGLVVDSKAHKAFSHHTLMANIEAKYCERGEIPVLVTKAERQRGEYVTVPLDFFAHLLNEVRSQRSAPKVSPRHAQGKPKAKGFREDFREGFREGFADVTQCNVTVQNVTLGNARRI